MPVRRTHIGGMYAERTGSGPALMLLHGSIEPGWETWSEQRPLAEEFELVVPHRSGYPPNEPMVRIDFQRQAKEVADAIEPGWHVVGDSYGGLIGLLAAPMAAERIGSLTVIEPPAFGVARGEDQVEEMVAALEPILTDSEQEPREFLERFFGLLGIDEAVEEPLPALLEAAVRATMAERPPWEAEIPLEELRHADIPTLVISSGSSPAFETVCDRIADEIGADREVVPTSGHSIPPIGRPLNDRLRRFVKDSGQTLSSGDRFA